MKVIVYFDGGSRGNPGPAGAGTVIKSADDGTVLYEAGLFIGVATNNVAEYSALVHGLQAAEKLTATDVHVMGDSQLLVRQMLGEYRVKNAGLKPFYQNACALRGKFEKFSIEHVKRDLNTEADKMANMAMDLKRNCGDAEDA